MPSHPRDETRGESAGTPKEVVSQGRTLDEAVSKAIQELGIKRDEAEVEVLDVGDSGLIGRLRGRQAKVRVRARDRRGAQLKEVTEEILKRMGVEAEVVVEGGDGEFDIDISTDGSDGLVIGHRGETLEALQHIVHRIVAGGNGPLFITVDVSGYRQRRRQYLESKARELANAALEQGREVVSEPMSAGERRILQAALGAIPQVQYRSLGEGTQRKVAVAPIGGRARGVTSRRPNEGSVPRESRGVDDRGIPPAPESAVGREWMRRPSQPREARARRTEFLSPSRGFAGTGYNTRNWDVGPARGGARRRGRSERPDGGVRETDD
jgi:spoIIIJ-associated protein